MIRPRQDADLPALVQVLREVHLADGYPGIWPGDPLAFLTTEALLGAWVAETDGGTSGQVLLCGVQPGSSWDAAGTGSASNLSDLAEIKRLFVAPSAWGLGLAHELMQAALAEAARRGRRSVLETRADNGAANRFYRRGGWQPAGTLRATWTDATGQRPLLQLYSCPE